MIVQFVIATWMEVFLPLMDFRSVSKALESVFVVMVPLEANVKDAWLGRIKIIILHVMMVGIYFSIQDGFYDISAGCLPCECNQGGSTSQVCDQNSANAQCPCIPDVESTTCRMPVAGYYSRALDDLIFEAEKATLAGVCYIIIIP